MIGLQAAVNALLTKTMRSAGTERSSVDLPFSISEHPKDTAQKKRYRLRR